LEIFVEVRAGMWAKLGAVLEAKLEKMPLSLSERHYRFAIIELSNRQTNPSIVRQTKAQRAQILFAAVAC
jgi:hypothetical protein